ncbi:MAG TPA: ABC transporter substrate-binding protein [Pseudobdellovibrionaceae bacterium]|nr:ABC transporter substrate-binding protein [Pseudobdellovibrionaceae bacterium]
MKKSFLVGLTLIGLVLVAVLVLRAMDPDQQAEQEKALEVGFLPVTCHLTCPVTDFATKTSTGFHYISKRFTDWPTVAEAFKSGRLHATFFVAPLAMKLVEQGVAAKIVYLGHRDGSTVIVHKDNPARDLRDLKGQRFAIPSRYSNQFLVIRKLMKDLGMSPTDLEFVEMAPPDMPGAIAARSIAGYFVGEPHAAAAEVKGTGRVLHHAKDIWPQFISCVLVVSQKLMDEKPEVVRDLVRGIAESGEWAETHRDEAANLVAPYFRQDEKLIHFVLHQPPDRVSYRTLAPTDEEMMRIHDLGREVGILERDLKLSDFLDRSFIPTELQTPAALETYQKTSNAP